MEFAALSPATGCGHIPARSFCVWLFSSFYSQVCNHCNAHVIPLIDAHDNQGVREYFFRDWENAGTVVGGHHHMTPA